MKRGNDPVLVHKNLKQGKCMLQVAKAAAENNLTESELS